jgi:Flp pilus assembly protein TadG
MKNIVLKRWYKCQSGIAAIEFALIIPALILLFVGLIDVTTYMSEQRKIQSISGTIADLVGQQRNYLYSIPASKTGELDDFFSVPALIMKPKDNTNVRVNVAVFGFTGTTFAQKWAVDNKSSLACAALPNTTAIKAVSDGVRDVIVVQSCTELSLYFDYALSSFNNNKASKVDYYVMVTPRVSNNIECYTSKLTITGPSTCP